MNSEQLIGYGTNANVDNLSKIYGTFRIDKDGPTMELVFVGKDVES